MTHRQNPARTRKRSDAWQRNFLRQLARDIFIISDILKMSSHLKGFCLLTCNVLKAQNQKEVAMKSYFVGLVSLFGVLVAWAIHSPLMKCLVVDHGINSLILLSARPLVGSFLLIFACKTIKISWLDGFHRFFVPGLALSSNFVLIQFGVLTCAKAAYAPMLVESAGAAMLVLLYYVFCQERDSTPLFWVTVSIVSVAVVLAICNLYYVGVSLTGIVYSFFCAVSWFVFTITFRTATKNISEKTNHFKARIAQTTALLVWVSIFLTPLGVISAIKTDISLITIFSYFCHWQFLWVTAYATGIAYLLFSISVNSKLGADGSSLGISLIAVLAMTAGYFMVGDRITNGLVVSGLLCILGNVVDFLEKNPDKRTRLARFFDVILSGRISDPPVVSTLRE